MDYPWTHKVYHIISYKPFYFACNFRECNRIATKQYHKTKLLPEWKPICRWNTYGWHIDLKINTRGSQYIKVSQSVKSPSISLYYISLEIFNSQFLAEQFSWMSSVLELRLLQCAVHVRSFALCFIWQSQEDHEPHDENFGEPKK